MVVQSVVCSIGVARMDSMFMSKVSRTNVLGCKNDFSQNTFGRQCLVHPRLSSHKLSISCKGGRGKGFSNKKTKAKRQKSKSATSTFIEDEGTTEDSRRVAEYQKAMGASEAERAAPVSQGTTDQAFEERLASLKSETSSGAKKPPSQDTSFLGSGPLAGNSVYEVNTTQGDLDNLGRRIEKTSDDGEGGRLGFQIGAVVAVVVFVIAYAGSDLQVATGGLKSSLVPQKTELSEEIKTELEAQVTKLTNGDFSEEEMVEGLAVTYAKLGEYEKADDNLKRLSKLKPDDPEVLRLWAEVKVKREDLKAAAKKYEEALALSADNPELLRPYIGVLSQQGRQAQAVAAINEIRPRAIARGNLGVAGSGSDPIDIVQLDLLLGKLFSEWSGHSSDAAVVYDRLVDTYPDDFRGYLAKGALLKDIGKAKDAERLFIKARFLAPDAARPLVDQVAKR